VSPPTLEDRIAALREGRGAELADPYELYAALRGEAPVLRPGAEQQVLVSRYRDVRAVYMDGERFRKEYEAEGIHARRLEAQVPEALRGKFREVSDFELLMMPRVDDPQHARLRRIAHRAFTPRVVAELESYVQRLTDEHLDAMEGRADVDLIAEFAYRVPLLAIARMLGVPSEDAPMIREWTNRRGAFIGRERRDAESIEPWFDALQEFRAYVRDLLAEFRHSRPDTNLVTALMDGGEDALGEDELVAMFVVLLFAGHETTTNLIGNGMLAMLRRREHWERLCADPDLAPTAVEELLRWDAPVQGTMRIARTELEIGGVEVRPDDLVLLLIGAANRDADAFERPDELDLARDPNRHLSFAVGQRFCLGASLARLEGRIAFASLARSYPDVALATEEAEWHPSFVLRGLTRLPVSVGARAR